MGSMLSRLKDKLNGGKRQAVRKAPRSMSYAAPDTRYHVEPGAPAVPWNNGPVGPDSFTRPVELPGSGATTIQGRVMDGNQFTLSDRTTDGRRQPADTEARASSNRERSEREKAERWDAQQRLALRKENASTPNIRRLRHLIREKYKLDVYVWSKRNVQEALRPHVEKKAEQSDQIFQEIIWIVSEWDEKVFRDPEEWRLAKRLQDGLEKAQNQNILWSSKPAWEREEHGDDSEHQADYSPAHGQTNGASWA